MNTKPNHIPLNSKKENLYDTLKNSNLFSEIKIVTIEPIPKFTELALSFYHCIIYDLLDGAYAYNNPSQEIDNYVRNGGNIIVTHDYVYYGLSNILGI